MEKEVGELCLILSCPAVVISSTGPAASAAFYSYSGECLGEFLAVEGEERDKCLVYRQRYTVTTSERPYYLYR